jgi:hypothetical protein
VSDIEDAAIETVAEAVAAVPQQRAMCSALARHAGNALARLTSHEEAYRTLTGLARRHLERMGRPQR